MIPARLLRQRMRATGIGFAGIEGAWWLPATEPFALPATLHDELQTCGAAIFALFDVVTDLFDSVQGRACGLHRLLTTNVPDYIPQLTGPGRVATVRPDFQLHLDPATGQLQPVVTELEICPSAHGFAHAMQRAYETPMDLVASFGRFLAGRTLLFVGVEQWSEFLIEQLAFCRALADAGHHGLVLYDQPWNSLLEQVRSGQRWQPPMFGVRAKTPDWNDDIETRLRRDGLLDFMHPNDANWPERIDNAAIFRFGYFDCFSARHLAQMQQWQRSGAALLTPLHFALDSKVVMAALQLPAVRDAIDARLPGALAALDRSIPLTLLVTPATAPRLIAERAHWVIKFAGYDRGNQAWGGRSLQIGAHMDDALWRTQIERSLALPWPVVAQPFVPSLAVDIDYVTADDTVQTLHQGATRLRSFLLREADGRATVCGAHLTVTSRGPQVSEATDSVQAPVIFTTQPQQN